MQESIPCIYTYRETLTTMYPHILIMERQQTKVKPRIQLHNLAIAKRRQKNSKETKYQNATSESDHTSPEALVLLPLLA